MLQNLRAVGYKLQFPPIAATSLAARLRVATASSALNRANLDLERARHDDSALLVMPSWHAPSL
eukprot:5513498-Alexandrium_andersonii.AAC.1